MTSPESFARAKKFFWSLLLIGIATILLIGYFEAKNLKEGVDYHGMVHKKVGLLDGISSHLNHQAPPVNHTLKLEDFQVLKTSNGTFKMLSAFYDARKFFVDRRRPEIKITALSDVIGTKLKIYCLLWFDDLKNPRVSEVHEYKSLIHQESDSSERKWIQIRLACKNPLAFADKIPSSVSIVEDPNVAATNKMKISFKKSKLGLKRPIAICTKPLTLEDDISMIMIEWIETWQVLGIEKIYFNVFTVNENLMKVLKFYEAEGKVEVRHFPKSLEESSFESLAMNDCFLRHMHEYEFITFVDIDEIIVPATVLDRNLIDFLGRQIREINLKENKTQSFVFDGYAVPKAFFFLDNNKHANETLKKVPVHFNFLQKVYRSTNMAAGVSKAFHSTETVDVINENLPMNCLGDESDHCSIFAFDQKDIKLHHYQQTCNIEMSVDTADICQVFLKNTIRDAALWNWRDEIIYKVHNVITKLKTLEIKVNRS